MYRLYMACPLTVSRSSGEVRRMHATPAPLARLTELLALPSLPPLSLSLEPPTLPKQKHSKSMWHALEPRWTLEHARHDKLHEIWPLSPRR